MRAALTGYALLLRWQAGRMLSVLPLFVLVQTLLSGGLILGLGMLLSPTDTEAAGYLATGAPCVALVTVGLVMVPLQVSAAKAEGSLEFLWAMPVPRLAYLAADLTVWLAVSLPGLALSVLMAALRFHLDLGVSASTVPTVALVAVSMPPVLAQLTAQALVFVVLMFSPINYPASRLPEWAALAHQVLPFEAMGQTLRHALAPAAYAVDPADYLLLAAYCVVGLVVTQRVMSRRR